MPIWNHSRSDFMSVKTEQKVLEKILNTRINKSEASEILSAIRTIELMRADDYANHENSKLYGSQPVYYYYIDSRKYLVLFVNLHKNEVIIADIVMQ